MSQNKEKQAGGLPLKSSTQRFLTGLMFTSPWLIGAGLFLVYPVMQSLYYSFTDYSILSDPSFIGLDNYQDLLQDEKFWLSIYNTFYFAAFSVPLSICASLLLAILLNTNVRGQNIFRTLFFIPSLLPVVCLALLWQYMLNGEHGLFNNLLGFALDFINNEFGTAISAPNWLLDSRYTKAGLIIAAIWTSGNTVVIFLAGLQEVPRELYESADIDGAGFFRRLFHITIPSISPILYFNAIMGIIGTLQIFTLPFVMMGGQDGPGRSLLFVGTYIFRNAFEFSRMGYACTIGFIFFFIVMGLTLLAHRFSKKHVYYEN